MAEDADRQAPTATLPKEDQKQLIQQCVEQVLKVLEREKQR